MHCKTTFGYTFFPFFIGPKGILPAGSRYKPGPRPGSPTGRYTAAGQSTVDTPAERKMQLVDPSVMKQQVA